MNNGSFGSAIGGSDPLQEAIARRATGQAGATQQVSPAAPTFNPQTQGTPQVSGSAPAPTSSGGVGGALPNPTSEAKIIIQALKGRLDAMSKAQIF